MTSKILTQLYKVKPKADKLKAKYEEISELGKEINELEGEILEIYRIVFNGFMSKRIDTSIEVKKEDGSYLGEKIVLNHSGICVVHSYNTKASSVGSFDVLFRICQDGGDVLEYVKDKTKKKLVKDFCKEIKRVKYLEAKSNLYFYNGLKIDFGVEDDKSNRIIKQIEYSGYSVNFNEEIDKGSFNAGRIDFNFLNTDNYAVIEQQYQNINKLLKLYYKLCLRMKKERELVIERLKKKFAGNLIIEELREKKK